MAITPLLKLLIDKQILVREIAITALRNISTELPTKATKKIGASS